jgi:Mrp family chromosome partitioning ATPase
VPPNPGEFAQSGTLRKILVELGQRADLVLVDAPPLLGVGDAVVLSGQIDVLLVIARLSRLRATTLNELQRVLLACPAPAIGVAATGADLEHEYAYSGYAPPLADAERERAST